MSLISYPGAGLQGPPGEQGPPGDDGSDAPFGRTIEVFKSNRNSAAFPGGHNYTPLSHYETADDYIAFEVSVEMTGTMSVAIKYSMSSSSASDVYFSTSWSAISDGSDPTAAAANGAPFVFTPPANTSAHIMPAETSASLSFVVFAGDDVAFRLNRLGTDEDNDIHTGDFRVISARVSITE